MDPDRLPDWLPDLARSLVDLLRRTDCISVFRESVRIWQWQNDSAATDPDYWGMPLPLSQEQPLSITDKYAIPCGNSRWVGAWAGKLPLPIVAMEQNMNTAAEKAYQEFSRIAAEHLHTDTKQHDFHMGFALLAQSLMELHDKVDAIQGADPDRTAGLARVDARLH